MTAGDEIIRSLREALSVSPDNVPLRQHLADTLLSYGRAVEAEEEYRGALALAPQNQKLQIGLAKALFAQEKVADATSVIEDLIKHSPDIISAETYLLYARLLLQKGEIKRARGEYVKALDADSSVADPTLAERLGFHPNKNHLKYTHPENEGLDEEDDTSDVVEGRSRLPVEGEESTEFDTYSKKQSPISKNHSA